MAESAIGTSTTDYAEPTTSAFTSPINRSTSRATRSKRIQVLDANKNDSFRSADLVALLRYPGSKADVDDEMSSFPPVRKQQKLPKFPLMYHSGQSTKSLQITWKRRHKIQVNQVNVTNKISSKLLTATICVFLILFIFTFVCLKLNHDLSHSTHQQFLDNAHYKAAYSDLGPSDGQIWLLNSNVFRQKRSSGLHSSDDGFEPTQGAIFGLSKDCGSSCSIRFQNNFATGARDQKELIIHLKQLPDESDDKYQERVIPLVQFIGLSDNETFARPSTIPPGCFYSTTANSSSLKTITNLCDYNGGMFGPLALGLETYFIEPLVETNTEKDFPFLATKDHPHRNRRSIVSTFTDPQTHLSLRPHLIYPLKRQSFEQAPINKQRENQQKLKWSMEITLNSNHTDNKDARSKRESSSWDHYVEVLVVVDYKMLIYHQQNLENYVLTLFHQVASIYRIIVLKHERAGPIVSNRAQETLQKFCQWQQMYNDKNDDSPNHHDVAILLTRHDICRATHKCDTLGLAELGTMCEHHKSCAIIEDNGLSAAFTIAHELGHIFNIPHDDESKCAEFMSLTKNNFHIMAPTLEYNTNPWSWSACSRAMLTRFLENHRSKTQCILDQPVERRYFEKMFVENSAPGTVYSVSQQCKFVFGSNAEICPYMPTCKRLWCSISIGYQIGCRTQHMPWADGTSCGDKEVNDFKRWCHRGNCVGMSPNQLNRIDGGWGEWKEWLECSRVCGGGVQKSFRDCDNPLPTNGGKYCVGQRVRYRPCNIQECSWDTPGFRELQCAEFNGREIGIHGVPKETKWVPKYTGVSENERCKLYCRGSASAAFYLLREKVTDGTPCDRHGDDICIDGTCHKAGCDHRLGSDIKRDICGICGGNGSSCIPVEGIYNERGSFGYNQVLRIPFGSANIEVTQASYNGQKEDDNYLALRGANGDFLLNGHYQVSVFQQQIPVLNSVLEYSGSDQIVERINGSGPIYSDIYVHVLSVGNLNPPNIRYKYMRSTIAQQQPPSNNPKPPENRYYWKYTEEWSECSRTCQGTQTQNIQCFDVIGNRLVHDEHCSKIPKPSTKERMCRVECFYKFLKHGKDSSDGYPFKAICVRSWANSDKADESVDETECLSVGLKKPENSAYVVSQSDSSLPTDRRWVYSEWTQCTETCGTGGVKRRTMHCADLANRRVDNRYCENLPHEPTLTECNRIPCPKWVYGSWSECSRSCDSGIRLRTGVCQNAAGTEFPAQQCPEERIDREKCNEHPCLFWRFSAWSKCSVTCGEGVETREARCIDKDNRVYDDNKCDVRERIVEKKCKNPDCPKWKLGKWSSCSVSCLDGFMTRIVECVDSAGRQISDKRCEGEKPQSHMTCNMGPCPYWRTGSWSECSVSCGHGIRKREVECMYRAQGVDDSLCSGIQKPENEQKCILSPCHRTQWEIQTWHPCSVSCGIGVTRREVNCVRHSSETNKSIVVNDRECSVPKPTNERLCEELPCSTFTSRSVTRAIRAIWTAGSWSECSKTCGNGTQQRELHCRDAHRDYLLPESECNNVLEQIPPRTRDCNLRRCTKWVPGPWQICSIADCGRDSFQQRNVSCEYDEADVTLIKKANESECSHLEKPESIRNQELNRTEVRPQSNPFRVVKKFGEWGVGDWSDCSMTCGNGWRRRAVFCNSLTETECIEGEKPVQFEQCIMSKCYSGSWKVGSWGECSKTCGEGVQMRSVWCSSIVNSSLPTDECPTNKCDEESIRTRSVKCIDDRNEVIPDSQCSAIDRPAIEHKCRHIHCPRWSKGKWSPCSTSCGKGVSKREVICKRRHLPVPESLCLAVESKPIDNKNCELMKCPSYRWRITPWSKCMDPCKPSHQHRRIFCLSNSGKQAANHMCSSAPEPVTKRKCSTSECPYEWVPGAWSTCSKTCGVGHHFRRIECKVKKGKFVDKPHMANTVAGAEVMSRMCMALEKPLVMKECIINKCTLDSPQWNIGLWSQCSKTCGPGFRRRKVRCLDAGNRVDQELCDKTTKPKRREMCFVRNCLPSDCAELKAQNTVTNSIDGNYTILVAGFRVQVYCHLMNETIPKTYLNVPDQTNFAEFYGKRLSYPFSCPYEGRRNNSCLCSDEGHVNKGLTHFSKIRIDLQNMKINPNDFTFTETLYGSPVTFATAGDCYSMSECPQGQFSIDLRGTGLKIVDDLQWTSQGHRTSSRLERSENNALIQGFCGGYCGECAPDRFKGLVIEVERRAHASIAG